MRVYIATLSLLLILGACANNDELENQGGTEKQIYQAASDQMEKGNYASAVKNFQLLEARFPFGPYAEQAQLEIIYAYYKSFDMEAAIESANRFVRLHPQHPNIDYAYYLRGLANYDEERGLFDRFLPADLTQRDTSSARQAFTNFSELIHRFPNSDYAADARARMIYLKNNLARYEINVANFYLDRGAYQAAANRGRFVIEHFPQSTAVGDALAVMVQAYKLMHFDELAQDNLKVLRQNYPNHPNLDKKGNFIAFYTDEGVKPGLVARLTGGLLGRDSPKQIDSRE